VSLAEKPVLTLGETAELLSVTERTIQTYIKRGKLRALDLGGAVRILNPLRQRRGGEGCRWTLSLCRTAGR